MTLKIENDYGMIQINSDVIATIAGQSASECYGLVGMASKSTTSGIAKLLMGDQMGKGVDVVVNDDGVVINLYVIVQFGTKISVVADNIIEKVKYNVEKQTGLKVLEVNLSIEGVRVQG